MSDALIATFRKAWRDASLATPGARAWRAVRVPRPGPLAVLAAIRESDRAIALLFETPIADAPANRARFEADGISMLEERNYNERAYRIAVTLERPDLDNIFGIVVADLIESATPHTAAGPAVASLFSRLTAWQAFLRARHSGLGREAVIGLIGELTVLRRLATSAGWPVAIDAWKGPTGGLHDFLRAGQALEVKTGAGVASAVDITSLDQMEDAGLSTLLLVHVHLTQAGGGSSLPALVTAIVDELTRSAPGSLRPFRDALLASGYVEVDADLYLALSFQPLAIRFYRVTTVFPRLTRPTVPQGILAATYRLDLRALHPHLVDEHVADVIMQQMGEAA